MDNCIVQYIIIMKKSLFDTTLITALVGRQDISHGELLLSYRLAY